MGLDRNAHPEQAQTQLIFGTYKQNGAALASQISRALDLGFTRFDTAQLYQNELAVGHALANSSRTVQVTTKLHRTDYPDKLRERLRKSLAALGSERVPYVLLHRPMPVNQYAALTEALSALGAAAAPGVSNFSVADLKLLLQSTGGVPPAVNQVEMHPFVPGVQELVYFCKQNAIRVQAHTVLAQGLMFSWPPLVEMARLKGMTPAQVLVRFAVDLLGEHGDVIVHSTNERHLAELVEAASGDVDEKWRLSDTEIAKMCSWSIASVGAPCRFYKHQRVPPVAMLSTSADIDEYVADVASQLEADLAILATPNETAVVSNAVLALPTGFGTRQIKEDPASHKIAVRMFPDARDPIVQYINAVKKLRGATMRRKKTFDDADSAPSCSMRKSLLRVGGPDTVSIEVLEPLAMPVNIADEAKLMPFFKYLASSGESALPAPTGALFPRGCLFMDGRMDLCKAGTGSQHISALCEAVRKTKATGKVRHFLLGNNVACQENPEIGAAALASLMLDDELNIETWYLAGNAIDSNSIDTIASALEANTRAHALWLKRNPIKAAGAAHLGRLLAKNKTLTLLDLDLTGLLNAGVSELLKPLTGLKMGHTTPLQHLYLGANGISEAGARAIADYIESSPDSALETLYLSMNRIGTAGAVRIANALCAIAQTTGRPPALKRLSFASCRLTDESLGAIVRAAAACHLTCLDLGYYKATADLGEKPNAFSSAAVTPLVGLIESVHSLQYLSVQYAGLKPADIQILRAAATARGDLCLIDGEKDPVRGVQDMRGCGGVRHPPCVVHIDSIYRGKD